jgi:alpha-glucan,water dikinase
MDPASQVASKFNFDGNKELQIVVSPPSPGNVKKLDFQVAHNSESLVLHWGAVRDKKGKWVLPSRLPDGTKRYENTALRTHFSKSGSNCCLKLEIEDPAVQAIEFLIFDEAQNKWFKNNGENFYVSLPSMEQSIADVSVPEDLVQTQAYLRWERKGKQNYSPEKEKVEYEAARRELVEEVARGVSVDDLRAKLTKKNDGHETKDSSHNEVKKITKGDIKSKDKKLEKKTYFHVDRTQRKKRDLMQILNKYTINLTEDSIPVEPKALTAVELYAKAKEEDGRPILSRKVYKLADKKLLVLVTKSDGKIKVHLAADFKEPVTLHWALSRKDGEWLAPPQNLLPPGSVPLDLAAETQLTISSSTDPPYQVQSFELEIDEESFIGMPFLLVSGGHWIKNGGSDFNVNFSYRPKQVEKKDAGDGKGTAKALLDKIADLESEAQKSFMHR